MHYALCRMLCRLHRPGRIHPLREARCISIDVSHPRIICIRISLRSPCITQAHTCNTHTHKDKQTHVGYKSGCNVWSAFHRVRRMICIGISLHRASCTGLQAGGSICSCKTKIFPIITREAPGIFASSLISSFIDCPKFQGSLCDRESIQISIEETKTLRYAMSQIVWKGWRCLRCLSEKLHNTALERFVKTTGIFVLCHKVNEGK